MSSKDDEQTRARAVRLVTKHAGEHYSEWAAIVVVVSGCWGMTTETQRRWVRQAGIDTGGLWGYR